MRDDGDGKSEILDSVLAEYLQGLENGQQDIAERLIARHPDLAAEIRTFADEKQQVEEFVAGEPAPTRASDSGGFIAPSISELQSYFSSFEILEQLGQGGMGAVYKARQKNLDRIVALKILPPQPDQGAMFAERFAREAKAMARLVHANIVIIFEFGQAGNYHYLVMEYVDGINLRHAIAEKAITAEQALVIVPQICEALHFAHSNGVVHRDVKPENILLTKDGHVKIADFGLAKLLSDQSVDLQLTATRQVIGTFRYMAPEQLEGQKDIDHRADIYSLGVVFYELLTGQLPVGRFELPSQSAKTDARLDEVVVRSLERNRDRRYQHASEIRDDIKHISSTSAPVASFAKPKGGIREAKTVLLTAAQEMGLGRIIVVLAIVGILFFFLPWSTISITGLNESVRNRFEESLENSRSPTKSVWPANHLFPIFGVGFLVFIVMAQLVSDRPLAGLKSPLCSIAAGLAYLVSGAYVVLFQPMTIHSKWLGQLSLMITGDSHRYDDYNDLIRGAEEGIIAIDVAPTIFCYIAIVLGLGMVAAGIRSTVESSIWKDRYRDPVGQGNFAASLGSAMQWSGYLMLIMLALSFAFFLYHYVAHPHYMNYSSMLVFKFGWITVWLQFFSAAAFCVFLAVAGNSLQTFRHRRLVGVALIIVMIPWNWSCVLGIPVGIMAWEFMRAPGTKTRFAENRVPVDVAARGLRRAGKWQFILGVLTLIGFSIGLIASLFELARTSGFTKENTAMSILAATLAVLTGLTALGAIAAYSQWNLRSFLWTRVASLIGLVPYTPTWILSYPISLWTLGSIRETLVDEHGKDIPARRLFTHQSDRHKLPPKLPDLV